MDTLDQILENLWGSDYVQANPNKSYKVQYNAEYLAIAQYMSGGARPDTTSYSKMGKVLVGLEDNIRANAPDPDPDPDPVPTPGGSGELGICLGASASSAWLAKADSLNPKWCREDTISQTKIDWANANGVKFIGLCNLARVGLATSKAKVDQWGDQITYWELDNEPYFDGVVISTWANQALQLAQHIRANFPTHKIILPMLVQTNGGDYLTGGAWSPWANQVIDAAPGLKTIIDGVAGHPYQPGKAPTTVLSVVDKVQAQLKAKGVDKPWHMTEFGWSVGTGGTAPNTQVSAALQAQYLNDIITGMRTRSWIHSMEVYCLQSWGTGYEASFGLFNPDMSDRPSAVTFRNLV